MVKKLSIFWIISAVFCLSANNASADYISIEIYEQENDVIVSHSGSLNISQFKAEGGSYAEYTIEVPYNSGVIPSDGYLTNFSEPSVGDTQARIILESVPSFGDGDPVGADSATGDYLHLEGGSLNRLYFLPEDVDENNILTVSGSMTFQNSTINSLGMDMGTYTITDSNFAQGEKIEMTITPEPATIALLGIGGFALRRKHS
ncbi:PEP-CTERM sorting domain-containing protein [Sedimentisphaera salicampi]|uniref:Ice-binding protein C-terminal domain-containing protein n=1 Tax=Sedimentisphaera salicampi TaxID=1941349 RepID=A0A1W6LMN6_9BACT|nr:PEP-CTERM sorting domain-containing protein [Sedimentisphaera salicampi]ARN57003.1 hypothetical protein STSP1_01396 [Sedimentisphaera salicampi]OXU14841.1 hypothetical protein SMSP1_01336 [Sedimentisphaera salicampi]